MEEVEKEAKNRGRDKKGMAWEARLTRIRWTLKCTTPHSTTVHPTWDAQLATLLGATVPPSTQLQCHLSQVSKVSLKPGLCLFKKTLLHQQYSNQVPGLISAPGYFCLAPASLSEISLRRGPEVSKVRCSFGLLSLFALGPETPSGLLCSAKVMPKPLNAPENVNPECTFQLRVFRNTTFYLGCIKLWLALPPL